ncbi:A1 cistron-splicing factor [Kockovaella imperatae]|uniref:A1 cistron-splicing factor n=1 Tax=Kockovaella imperatae TaxID=4999 RepID=A0A1Y1UCS3_9TREE|nr:A1 cistron-splicing factor [Kockovaella imperatae]ORX35812.1 A1 cistron-splicing factor [Kockovaella imperatae]
MDRLTSAQAQALFEAGGFIIISDLPQGSEFGIDGTYHVTRRFSGIKFLPPGLHLITWSPPPSSTPGPSTIPIKSALLRITKPKERLVLSYDTATESIATQDTDQVSIISDDHVRTLDPELAPYPFNNSEKWSQLTNLIDERILDEVVGPDGRVDGIMLVDGEEDELGELKKASLRNGKPLLDASKGEIKRLTFPKFDLRRSWRSGAVGDEVTRYSQDKSWLMGELIKKKFDNKYMRILSYLQLSFVLLLHLSSYSCLMVYKRFFALLTRSADLLQSPSSYIDTGTTNDLASLYTAFLRSLTAQFDALPETIFESELPEMDLFFLDELEYLRGNLGSGMVDWIADDRARIQEAWKLLQGVVVKWRWDLKPIVVGEAVDDDDDIEDGEYAPVVVEE